MYTEQGTGIVQTGEDLLQQLLSSVLNQVMPMGGGALANMLTPLTRKLLGNDIAWDMPVLSNTTAEGVYQNQLRTQVKTMQQELAKGMQQSVTENLVRDWERSKVSFEDWQVKHPKGTRDEYDAFIEYKTRASMDSGIYKTSATWLNNAFDFNGGAGVGEALGNAAANFARQGFANNDPNSIKYAQAMVQDLFLHPEVRNVQQEDGTYVPTYVLDKNGKPKMTREFNRMDWAGMTQKSVADIAAALSKETDYLRGIDPNKTDELKQAADRFKNMVHEYSIALSPLKDVFGDDTASMISSLERMSGMSVTQLGSLRASNMASQLRDRYNSGMYGTQFLTTNIRTMQGLVDELPELSAMHYMNAVNMGIRGSDMARGSGAAPSYMRKDQWDKTAMKLAFQTSVAPATENIAMDYSIWAKRQEIAGKDTQWSAFLQELRPLIEDKNMDIRAAAGVLSGAKSYAAKTEGRMYNYYDDAITRGYAADLSMDGAALKARREAARSMRMDLAVENAMKTIGSRSGAEFSFKTKNEYIKQVMDVLENRSDIHGIKDMQHIQAALEGIKAVDKNGKELDQYAYTKSDAELMSVMIHGMFNAPENSKEKQWLEIAYANSSRADRVLAENTAKERQDRYAQLSTDLAKPGAQVVGDLLAGGFSIENIRQRLVAGGYISQIKGGYNDPANLAGILSAAGQIAAVKYGKGSEEDRKQAQSGYVSRFYKYANSAEGIGSKSFQRNLEIAMTTDIDAVRDSALRRLDAEITYGAKAVAQFDQDVLYDSKGNRIGDDVDRFYLLKGKTADELALMHVDSTIYGLNTLDPSGLTKQLQAAKKNRDKLKLKRDAVVDTYGNAKAGANKQLIDMAEADLAAAEAEVADLEELVKDSRLANLGANKAAQDIWKSTRKRTSDGADIKKEWQKQREQITMLAEKDFKSAQARLTKAMHDGDATDLTRAQAYYDRMEQQYHDKMAAVEMIDRELGTAKRDMAGAPKASDSLELTTVLNELNNTLKRFQTDGFNVTKGRNPGNNGQTQDSGNNNNWGR